MRVAVLGAGLQGACAALELSLHGVEVDLSEKGDYRSLSLLQTAPHGRNLIFLEAIVQEPIRQALPGLASGPS